MTNKELRLQIRALGEGRFLPPNKRLGLCWFLQQNCADNRGRTDYQYWTVIKLMRNWPGNSGDWCYPVPHPTLEPIQAFVSVSSLWEPETAQNKADKQYIENRLSMCRYIARKLAQLEDWK